MAQYTQNYGLYRPNRNDNDIEVDTSLDTNFQKIDTEIKNRANEIGDLSTLKTTNKSNAVAAINETFDRIGDLTTLNTTIKDSSVGAINELYNRIDNLVMSTGETNSEIVDARYDSRTNTTYTTLKDRLDSHSNEIGILLKIQQQTDFVDLIKKRVGYNRFRLRKLNSTQTEIIYDDGNKHITYRLNKDPNDDYVKINKVYAGDVGDLVVSKYDITSNDITGTWNVSSMAGNNWYTQDKTTPATFTARVTGTTIKFVSYTDDRGGIWEFVIDGDVNNKVTLSTWSATPKSTVQQTIMSGLEYKEHTVVATFKGDDPNHVPSTGAGTARGWVYVNPSLSSLGSVLGCIKASNPEGKRLLVDGSNKEFAFSVTYNGVTNWIPEHYGVGTVFKIDDIQYVIDNVVTDISTLPDNTYIEFKASLVINQHCYCRISDTDIAELWLSYYFNKDGSIKWSGKLKALQNFTINDGYPLMLPVANETFSEIVTGLYNSRISDYSGNTYYFEEEKDLVSSCCAIDATNKDYIVACKLDTIMHSMRLKDATGKPAYGQSLFLSQRTDFPKLYYVSFKSKNMVAGEFYTWGGEIIGATINNAYGIIK